MTGCEGLTRLRQRHRLKALCWVEGLRGRWGLRALSHCLCLSNTKLKSMTTGKQRKTFYTQINEPTCINHKCTTHCSMLMQIPHSTGGVNHRDRNKPAIWAPVLSKHLVQTPQPPVFPPSFPSLFKSHHLPLHPLLRSPLVLTSNHSCSLVDFIFKSQHISLWKKEDTSWWISEIVHNMWINCDFITIRSLMINVWGGCCLTRQPWLMTQKKQLFALSLQLGHVDTRHTAVSKRRSSIRYMIN